MGKYIGRDEWNAMRAAALAWRACAAAVDGGRVALPFTAADRSGAQRITWPRRTDNPDAIARGARELRAEAAMWGDRFGRFEELDAVQAAALGELVGELVAFGLSGGEQGGAAARLGLRRMVRAMYRAAREQGARAADADRRAVNHAADAARVAADAYGLPESQLVTLVLELGCFETSRERDEETLESGKAL